jgi:uncharacterized hydrophobic protein (TIGR00271 family)
LSTHEAWSSLVRSLQHRMALALGVDEARRSETVLTMLVNNRRRAPGYWIQLVLAMGIATLGLVLNSTAVVIGAMLVSPLMGPIVELGMGFAVGSSFLVLRASLRVALSAIVVIAGAALLTTLLPFHEVTAEIAARAAPTALDLLVAIFCALTAAYTTVRSASDTTSAAAGTAIGIALVPPLCATGFGIGTGLPAVAAGAVLLFTANLSAIFVFSIAAFLALGYNQVDAANVESDVGLSDSTRTDVLAARGQATLQRLFGSRYGMVMRLLIPIVFLAAVYVPLRRALDEVTWEVRARDAIRRAVSAETPSAVQTSISVERHAIALRLLIVGSLERASAVEETIRQRVQSATGVKPDVAVTAMPDAASMAAAARTPAADAPEQLLDPARVADRISGALGSVWPRGASGELLGWELIVGQRRVPTLITYHAGDSLGRAGASLLAATLSTRLNAQLVVADSTLLPATITAPLGAEARWSGEAQRRLEWLSRAASGGACIRGPVSPTRRPTSAQTAALMAITQSAAAIEGRVSIRDSSGWRMTLVKGPCGDTAATVGAAR